MRAIDQILGRLLPVVARLAPAAVQASVYVAPASFNPATGEAPSVEAAASVTAVVVPLRPREWDLVNTQPGDEKVTIRASELGSIVPVAGHYLVEAATGQRRDVTAAEKDASGTLWRLRVARSLNEDFGDLTAATAADDWGDLSAVTSSDDRGALL